jgi:DNA-binding MarR family transcriptional regulator
MRDSSSGCPVLLVENVTNKAAPVMDIVDDFELEAFLPYALNRAAEAAGRGFQAVYKARFGMLRTEWRVLAHLGRYGEMTARDICIRADLHKTKVSRAVKALETRRFLSRRTVEADRRREVLALTPAGAAAYRLLAAEARTYDAALAARLPPEDLAALHRVLRALSALDQPAGARNVPPRLDASPAAS